MTAPPAPSPRVVLLRQHHAHESPGTLLKCSLRFSGASDCASLTSSWADADAVGEDEDLEFPLVPSTPGVALRRVDQGP